MLSVQLICVGKMKEKYYIDAVNEYAARILPYCKFEVKELTEERLSLKPSEGEVLAALSREAKEIKACIDKKSVVIAMCVEGKSVSSEKLAVLMENWAAAGRSKLCFVIGSSNGLDSGLKNSADLCISMSKMTFPHHLARVMIMEQIYRGFMINNGTKYHK